MIEYHMTSPYNQDIQYIIWVPKTVSWRNYAGWRSTQNGWWLTRWAHTEPRMEFGIGAIEFRIVFLSGGAYKTWTTGVDDKPVYAVVLDPSGRPQLASAGRIASVALGDQLILERMIRRFDVLDFGPKVRSNVVKL